MAEFTAISWAHHTFNCWWGCRKVSLACRFCYAERDSNRWGIHAWGSKGERRMMSEAYWHRPLTWNRKALASGEQVRVFCASMADVFEDHPAVVDARVRLWELIEQTPALTWMLLTKRPQNIGRMVPWDNAWPANVWLGVSAETQRFADERLPVLLRYPAAVRFVSAAPLLAPVNLRRYLAPPRPSSQQVAEVAVAHGIESRQYTEILRRHLDEPRPGVDWVITEGESGPRARPSHPDWFRSLRDQSAAMGVAFHHKQNGEWHHKTPVGWPWGDAWTNPNRHRWVDPVTGSTRSFGEYTGTDDRAWAHVIRVGKKAAGRLLDGELHDAFPQPRRLVGVAA
ncbi:DUF5131 family protein [Micromonospora sp. DT227]|uniref:DUF5131 family protein n=1 Tax=Micromonospora sp. DT227 TaxID=3393433 RepID=UPI003CEFBF02